jgi:hypothetical protein
VRGLDAGRVKFTDGQSVDEAVEPVIADPNVPKGFVRAIAAVLPRPVASSHCGSVAPHWRG